MTGLAQLPPLGQHSVPQLRGWTCVLCDAPVPRSADPLAKIPARYADYRFVYQPTACAACAPRIPRPVQLPALAQDRPTHYHAGGTP
ncbi:hypothetical protein [Streptomyces sp. NPDC059906]|uniref:hypothetical protein n=1 Tax=Streptomyces sp. NPDC059906 TaxID=3346997 RepID=UPI003664C373